MISKDAVQTAVLLPPGDCHFLHFESWRSEGTSKLQVVSHHGNSLEHLAEVARNRHLFHRVGQLAALNPEARRPEGDVPGNHVHAESHEFGHVEPTWHGADDLFR